MRVIPKRHWARSQRRRVRQTRFAHPAPATVTTHGAAKKRSEMAPAERCTTGNAAAGVWPQDAAKNARSLVRTAVTRPVSPPGA